MQMKVRGAIFALSLLVWVPTGLAYASDQSSPERRITDVESRLQALSERLSDHKQRLDTQDIRTAIAGIAILVSFGLGIVTLISKSKDRDKDEAVNAFRLTYADRLSTVLSELDLTSATLAAICDDPLPSSRVNKVSKLWTGDLSDTLIKMESILQALDRAEDVPGKDWGTGTDETRDQLEDALGKLCDETLVTKRILEKCSEVKSAIDTLCGYVEQRLKLEITRRHRGKNKSWKAES